MAYIVNICRSIVCHMLPIEVTSCRAGLPRSPKDFQELLLGSAVYVGVGREPFTVEPDHGSLLEDQQCDTWQPGKTEKHSKI